MICEDSFHLSNSSLYLPDENHEQLHQQTIYNMPIDRHDFLQEMYEEDDDISTISICSDSNFSIDSLGVAIGIGISMGLNETPSQISNNITRRTAHNHQRSLQDISMDLHHILKGIKENYKLEPVTSNDQMRLKNPLKSECLSSSKGVFDWDGFLVQNNIKLGMIPCNRSPLSKLGRESNEREVFSSKKFKTAYCC